MIAHPAIREAAVVARDDESGLTKAAAYVVVNDDVAPSDQLIRDLQDWVAERIGSYKRPRWIEFLPELHENRYWEIAGGSSYANCTPGKIRARPPRTTLNSELKSSTRVNQVAHGVQ